MITEETIKQTRFFKGIDEKFYLASEVKEVILVTLIDCSDGKESQLILGDEVCCRFDPVDVRFQSISNRKVANMVIKGVPQERDFAATGQKPEKEAGKHGNKKPAVVRGGKATSSRFKGVKKSKKGYADGRPRFEVSYRNPETKKQEYLGSFDNQYLAAAAYEERAGNKVEAERLRELADMTTDESREKPERPSKRLIIHKWTEKPFPAVERKNMVT